jgi:hypothetical protein
MPGPTWVPGRGWVTFPEGNNDMWAGLQPVANWLQGVNWQNPFGIGSPIAPAVTPYSNAPLTGALAGDTGVVPNAPYPQGFTLAPPVATGPGTPVTTSQGAASQGAVSQAMGSFNPNVPNASAFGQAAPYPGGAQIPYGSKSRGQSSAPTGNTTGGANGGGVTGNAPAAPQIDPRWLERMSWAGSNGMNWSVLKNIYLKDAAPNDWAAVDRGLERAWWDGQWSQIFQRMNNGRPPNQLEWQEHYYATRGTGNQVYGRDPVVEPGHPDAVKAWYGLQFPGIAFPAGGATQAPKQVATTPATTPTPALPTANAGTVTPPPPPVPAPSQPTPFGGVSASGQAGATTPTPTPYQGLPNYDWVPTG